MISIVISTIGISMLLSWIVVVLSISLSLSSLRLCGVRLQKVRAVYVMHVSYTIEITSRNALICVNRDDARIEARIESLYQLRLGWMRDFTKSMSHDHNCWV